MALRLRFEKIIRKATERKNSALDPAGESGSGRRQRDRKAQRQPQRVPDLQTPRIRLHLRSLKPMKRENRSFPKGAIFIGVFHPIGLIRLGQPTSKISLPDDPCGSETTDKQHFPPRFHYFPGILPFRFRSGPYSAKAMEGRPTEPDQHYLYEWLAPRRDHPPIKITPFPQTVLAVRKPSS